MLAVDDQPVSGYMGNGLLVVITSYYQVWFRGESFCHYELLL